MDREHWRALSARHRPCDTETRRCEDCAAYWPCCYRLRADAELAAHGGRAVANRPHSRRFAARTRERPDHPRSDAAESTECCSAGT